MSARVLIVDDDPDLLELVSTALEAKGYRVFNAPDGRDALRLLETEPVDLILLDMRMPNMDGWTFARIFHARYDRKTPIVVLTAAQDAKLRADEIGADGHLEKPFDMKQLYSVVESMTSAP